MVCQGIHRPTLWTVLVLKRLWELPPRAGHPESPCPVQGQQLVGHLIEHSLDVDNQMLLTPEGTSDVSDSRGGGGGWDATCGLPVDIHNGRHVVRTDQNVLALWSGSGQDILPATRDNWYTNTVGTRLYPWHCVPVVRGSPAGGRGIREHHRMPGYLLQGHSCLKEQGISPRAEGCATGRCNLNPVSTAFPCPPQDSADAVSHGSDRAELSPQLWPYTPGASEKVSVGPPSFLIKSWGSSAPTEHVPGWGVLSGWLNPTPCREKRSSALAQVGSFLSWPEDPTGWGAWSLGPCVRTTARETAQVWASHRGSWGCAHPVLSGEQGSPPWLWWRHEATGIARRAGPCTDMPDPRMRITGIKVRVLQVDCCKPI